MKFLEIAKKLLARKNQIVEIRDSISTLLDDFNKNWETEGPQALRCVFEFCRIEDFNSCAVLFSIKRAMFGTFVPKVSKPYSIVHTSEI